MERLPFALGGAHRHAVTSDSSPVGALRRPRLHPRHLPARLRRGNVRGARGPDADVPSTRQPGVRSGLPHGATDRLVDDVLTSDGRS